MSNNYAISLKRSTALVAAITFMAVLTATNFASVFSNRVSAAQLESRSLTLSSSLAGTETSGSPGDPTNGSAATHTFAFTTIDDSVSSVVLRYCTTAIGTCTGPTGLVLGSAASAGNTVAVANYDSGTNNQITVTLGSAWNTASAKSLVLTSVTNPTTVAPFFVRIVAGDDEGTVASAITEGIEITSRVAETLGFSTTGDFTGVGVPGTGCDPVTGSGAITLGDPVEQTLSITQAYDNYSAFRLYTNSANGVNVQYEADTLRRTATSEIAPVGTSDVSVPASEQFGLAVDSVSTGSVSTASRSASISFANVDQSAALADAGNGPLDIAAGYANGNGTITTPGATAEFSFTADTPTTIASTDPLDGGFTNCKTVAVRYLANISPLTPAGTYRTTVVYSAVPTY